MRVKLTRGETVVVRNGDRTRCSDDCPFMEARYYEPDDPMDRCRVVWTCSLTGESLPFAYGRFKEIRNQTCLNTDPEREQIPAEAAKEAARAYAHERYFLGSGYTLYRTDYDGRERYEKRYGKE